MGEAAESRVSKVKPKVKPKAKAPPPDPVVDPDGPRMRFRAQVRGNLDIQKTRIGLGNRVVESWKVKNGKIPGKAEKDELSGEAKSTLKTLKLSYKRITDGVVRIRPHKFEGDGVIGDYATLKLVEHYVALERVEREQLSLIRMGLEEFPIWNEYLERISGIGPAMGGIIVAEFDIHKARHVSSLWKYAGLDVAKDGLGRSRRAEHLVDVEYLNAAGETKTKKAITFNPTLKTKLIGVMSANLIKCGHKRYRQIYDQYRYRLAHREDLLARKDEKGWKGHMHNMALRYMVKQFLRDLFPVWRALEGLDFDRPYDEALLGHSHLEKLPPPWVGKEPPKVYWEDERIQQIFTTA